MPIECYAQLEYSIMLKYTLMKEKSHRTTEGSPTKKHTKAGDTSSIPGLGRFPGGENGNPLQYSCLGNPTDREAWWATAQGVTKELGKTE